jgi:hypothetical protein
MVLHTPVSLPPAQRLKLRALLRRLGPTKAPAVLGASRSALERAAGNLPIRLGTALLIGQALEKLPRASLPSSPAVTVEPQP